jgi:DNA-binding protein HU-beta
MSKAILIEAVQKKRPVSGRAARDIVDAVFETIARNLKKDGSFSVTGFGSFRVARRAARNVRHPQTGKLLKIRAGKRIAFKAGTELKDRI